MEMHIYLCMYVYYFNPYNDKDVVTLQQLLHLEFCPRPLFPKKFT